MACPFLSDASEGQGDTVFDMSRTDRARAYAKPAAREREEEYSLMLSLSLEMEIANNQAKPGLSMHPAALGLFQATAVRITSCQFSHIRSSCSK